MNILKFICEMVFIQFFTSVKQFEKYFKRYFYDEI